MSISGRVGLIPNYASNIPGTVLQLDAATLSASPVSSWSYAANPNGGPNNFTTAATGNFTQATGASQPLWTASSSNTNGQPSVIYDGTKFMSTPNTSSLQLGQDLTIATILYIPTSVSNDTIISKVIVNGEFDCYVPSVNASIVRNGTIIRSNGLYVANKLFSLVLVISSGVCSAYYNGAYVSGGNVAGNNAVTTNAVQIGQRADAATALNGEQPELLLINRSLSPIEIATLHSFWATKYNLLV